MKVRATAGAVLVVAIALIAGAVALVVMVRESLRDGLEAQAEQQIATLATQLGAARPGTPGPDPAPAPDGTAPRTADEDDDEEPEDLVWQVIDASGAVAGASRSLPRALPAEDTARFTLPGADHPYLVRTDRAGGWTIAVGVSLEDVDNGTEALVTPLLTGIPLLLLVCAAVTWIVVARALAPIERIRREAEEITGDRLDRRVPEPASRDEVHRMARTMNRMLARLQASRERQQRFVADASHELRSPLTSIRQAAEVADALPAGYLAETVLEESARMSRLVDQLLVLTRAGEGAVTRTHADVDLDDLLLAEAARVRRAGLTVDTTGVAAGRVRADRVAMGQVVRNLADNAARHATARVAVALRRTADGVELTVDDDGHGIAADQRERVFDRFVRLDEARARDDGGSGLGLAIVKEIINGYGGSVTAAESPLGGARFTVRLPSSG
ncbi:MULTISPECIES: sensor histidine kinase [Catenuloplanes]|uniref:histidine kinase n=1 Tax=Catenuloplanes niger TaxID=587534 RepID=A0AAE3ZI41_9ACTN|nr:HAMP domain-containing sensor histidine kinase [Catenuloplanes niger]MDR7320374.1 signal transduction histidine kinase [Catenuloplanes niger]